MTGESSEPPAQPRAGVDSGASGPRVARLFHQLLGVTFIVAFLSLGAQVHALIGSRGLVPLKQVVDAVAEQAARGSPVALHAFPTLFRFDPSDAALSWGIWVGVTLGALVVLGIRSQLCLALATVIYLSFTVAARDFLAFQWDNLLIECGFIAAFLPANRPAPIIHLLLRIVLFKLYFESGIAKYQSHLGDWHDGSAMTFYYETAPIPTLLAHHAHHLPDWWHHFESRATLVWEIGLPFAFFAPRRFRLAAAALVTAFQVVNIATANYGFFSYLAMAMHVVLLGDADLTRASLWWSGRLRRARVLLSRGQFRPRPVQACIRLARRRLRRARSVLSRNPALPEVFARRARTAVALVLFAGVVGISAVEGVTRFVPPAQLGEWSREVLSTWSREVSPVYRPLRFVNTYHLFGHITRQRIEPEIQTLEGGEWRPRHLHYKPGPLTRSPPFVAPHQPRLDFRLWFYGLSWRRGTPGYVRNLLTRVCDEPEAVASLFSSRLPRDADAVRIVFWDYRFTTPETLEHTGQYWARTRIGETRALRCSS